MRKVFTEVENQVQTRLTSQGVFMQFLFFFPAKSPPAGCFQKKRMLKAHKRLTTSALFYMASNCYWYNMHESDQTVSGDVALWAM